VFKSRFREFLAQVGAPITEDMEPRPPQGVLAQRVRTSTPEFVGLGRGATA
jgi:hypothetical protein